MKGLIGALDDKVKMTTMSHKHLVVNKPKIGTSYLNHRMSSLSSIKMTPKNRRSFQIAAQKYVHTFKKYRNNTISLKELR